MKRELAAVTIAVAVCSLPLTASAAPHAPAAASRCHTTVPSDFNGNGRSDLAVGAPSAPVSTKADGTVTIFNGKASGLGPQRRLTRPAVAGFGTAMATGDFNGDGCADLVVVNREGPGVSLPHGHRGDGLAAVYYRHPGSGLSAANAQRITPADVPGVEKGCYRATDGCPVSFGPVVGAADVNGDGYADLLIFAIPVIDGDGEEGELIVVPGSATGLKPAKATVLPFGAAPFRGTVPTTQIDSISVGDINGDGIVDVAIGFDDGGGGCSPGVDVLYGAKHGLGTGRATQLWDLDRKGVPGKDANLTNTRVVLGDFNGDGYADLAFAEALPSVTAVYGSSHGLTTKHLQTWSKASPGVKGHYAVDDNWGSTLAAGRFGTGKFYDLVVADGHNGHLSILAGSRAHGLTAKGNLLWSKATPGIPGTARKGFDFDWGWSLAVGYFGHGRGEDLAVGEPESDGSRGAITILYGSTTRPIGLRAAHAQRFTADSPGVPGTAHRQDEFGASLS